MNQIGALGLVWGDAGQPEHEAYATPNAAYIADESSRRSAVA